MFINVYFINKRKKRRRERFCLEDTTSAVPVTGLSKWI